MNVEQLRMAASTGVELALHSHHHVNYGALTAKLLAGDVQACVNTFGELGLPYIPALAYPFGRRPNKKSDYLAMVSVFEKAGVKAAFRIGNRVNSLPLCERFEIQRIGVRGDESLAEFQRRIKRGRWF
jgi:peptidoglycan/xylan/chitin deacetylase (PgdA/CDA1 family)